MSTPATYTIQTTGDYSTLDGKQRFSYQAGQVIPMALAIAMGLEGAGYATPPVFKDIEEQRIEALIAQAGGSGGGSVTLPTDWTTYYDNRTAGAGQEPEANYTIYDFTMVGGLIYIGEPNKWMTHVGIRVITGAVGATARLSLYAASGNANEPTLAGTLVKNAGTLNAATSGFKSIAIAGGPEVPPAFYWIMVEPSAEITIAGFSSFAGYLGQNQTTGAVYSGMSYNVGESMAAHAALLDGGNREPVAPLVLFRIDDV